ncbi:hypothetical protein [Burkholderia sp. BCC1993]|uniref:hypothetical protein n=1 Tax=Burkholderia sp. BCC1993 TaxID=2817444 RepID=UPI002AB1E7AC|nr:hypothetical protein [Burkholderia sp. BCC1993]
MGLARAAIHFAFLMTVILGALVLGTGAHASLNDKSGLSADLVHDHGQMPAAQAHDTCEPDHASISHPDSQHEHNPSDHSHEVAQACGRLAATRTATGMPPGSHPPAFPIQEPLSRIDRPPMTISST